MTDKGLGFPNVLRAGVLGVSGYTGREVFSLLLRHPGIRVTTIADNNTQGAMALLIAFAARPRAGDEADGEPRDERGAVSHLAPLSRMYVTCKHDLPPLREGTRRARLR